MTRSTVCKAIIPAAGHGTRLLPLTRSQPKEIVACGPNPVIGYVLNELREAGIKDLLLISRRGKASLEEYVFDAWPGACVIWQPEQLGLADAVSVAQDWTGRDSFVVALGDTILHSTAEISPLQRMIRLRPTDESSLVLVRRVPPERVNRYGIVAPALPGPTEADKAERPGESEVFAVRDIIEKPSLEDAPSNLAIAGRYLFSPDIFSALAQTPPRTAGEVQLTDAMTLLGQTGPGMFALPLREGEQRFDIGSLDSYYEAFAALTAIAGLRQGQTGGRTA